MESNDPPIPPVVWLVTEDAHLVRADTITTIGITGDQLTVWQGDRATTVVQVGDRPRFSTSYAGNLAAELAAASSSPSLGQTDGRHPVVYVWLHLDDDPQHPCWQIAVKGSHPYADPPEPPFSTSAPD